MSPENNFSPEAELPEQTNHRHAVLLVCAVAVLAVAAWAGSLLFGAQAQGSSLATVTPTKTAIPPMRDGANGAVLAPSVLPTFTPIPTRTPIPSPAPQLTPADASDRQPEPWVKEIAAIRGLNPEGDYVIVDQNNQTMHVIEAGDLARELHITTGDPESGWDTPAWFGVIGEYWGTFQGRGGVLADEGWWLFDRPGGNFLIHSLPYIRDAAGNKHYKGVEDLGASPASNGCIRLSPEDAAWFTSWQPAGKPIIILPYTGLHANQG